MHIGHAFNKILKDFVVKPRPARYFTPTSPVGTATDSPSSIWWK
ncbi:MAG: hypothetical protein ACLUW6_11530 [Coriobacteriaceae bacterium]